MGDPFPHVHIFMPLSDTQDVCDQCGRLHPIESTEDEPQGDDNGTATHLRMEIGY